MKKRGGGFHTVSGSIQLNAYLYDMPNPIKYTAGTETLALKKGNFYIGTGDVGKGPSDSTGYYQGPSPASGGYVIYLNKEGAPGSLSYHSAANDSELISFTNSLANASFTSATQCLKCRACPGGAGGVRRQLLAAGPRGPAASPRAAPP